MPDLGHRHIEDELRGLATQLDVPAPTHLRRDVQARVSGLPAPGAHGERRRWADTTPPRWLAAVLVAVLAMVALAATPPGRAAVTAVLRFAGIEVHQGKAPATVGQPVLPGERQVSLAAARSQSSFPVAVPATLRRPDAVRLADGPPPRVVSLLWGSHPGLPLAAGPTAARLDEFDGSLGPVFDKIAAAEATRVTVDGVPALWVPGPQVVLYVGRDGTIHEQSARLAANTLIWERSGVTLRLEGAFTQDEAVAVATGTR